MTHFIGSNQVTLYNRTSSGNLTLQSGSNNSLEIKAGNGGQIIYKADATDIAIFNEGSVSFLKPMIKRIVNSNNISGPNGIYSIAETIEGIINRDPNGSDKIDSFGSYTDFSNQLGLSISAITNPISFTCTVRNVGTADNVTVNAGIGNTMIDDNNVIGPKENRIFRFILDTSGSPKFNIQIDGASIIKS